MSFTNYLSATILNHIFSKAAYIAPSLYVAVMGSARNEPSTGSYARVLVPASSWSVASVADPSVISNTALISFPKATADWLDGWPLIYLALFDAPTGGNMLALATLDAQKAIVTGNTATFPVGAATFSLT